VIEPERFSRVDELFDAALDQPVAKRSAWLAAACGGDEALRGEVEELLRLAERDDALVESGALRGPVWDDVVRELASSDELVPGDQVGCYAIHALIGRGGMGAVYRARDLTLGRDVAIKALNQGFAPNASAIRRFEREAKLLASLNHPNIASIYDLIEVEERRFLVLELVEGETLSDRLARGPLAPAEAIPIATQVAEGLEEAHRKGVVHRDLKPSNVKLTREGRVKVLDFGLAKGEDDSIEAGGTTPKMTAPTTQFGAVLGTPGYMSPEQARGLAVDKRSDIWAFGCLLYEMLTGARAFAGKTVSDAIAAVLRDEVDWSRLPRSTPPELERLLRRSLKQDARERLQDIGDARIELEDLAREGRADPGRYASRWRPSVAAFALGTLLAFLAGAALLRILDGRARRTRDLPLSTSVVIRPPERLWQGASSSIAISPDGARIAYVSERDGKTGLFVRSLDAFDPLSVDSSEGARDPFFSPDGEWVGFFASGEMRRVHLASGSSSTIAETSLPSRGASWGEDGRIVFAQDGARGLFVVNAGGGTLEPLFSPEESDAPVDYLWPQWLPGQSGVLFTSRKLSSSGIADELVVVDSDSASTHVIGRGTQGTYVPSGHLVYAAAGAIEAMRFDIGRRTATGGSFRVVESVNGYPTGAHSFCVSPSGTLLFVEPLPTNTLDWIDREGARLPVDVPRGAPGWPRLSPDGRFAAIHVGGPETRDVWLLDLERPGSFRQLTYQGGGFPVWSHDGRSIAFMSRHEGSGDLYRLPADGSGSPERIVSGERTKIPVSWSASGVLAYYEIAEATERDIWVVDLAGDRTPRPFLATPANELSPVFSPDGRHIAYVSNETGQNEVYVRPFPGPGPVTPISIDGGSEPVWRGDGNELFYRHRDTLMSVSVRYSPRYEVGRPAAAIDEPLLPGSGGNASYDVRKDASRFLALRPPPGGSVDELRLVLNWTEAFGRLAPKH
jgi:serine/threonine-protein kinase